MDSGLNYLDMAFLVVILCLAIRGALRGFIAEIAGVVATVGGVLLAAKWYRPLGTELSKLMGHNDWAYIVAFFIIMLVFVILVGIIAEMLGRFMSIGCIDPLNRIGGAAAGFLKGLGIVCVAVYAVCFVIPQSDLVRQSRMIPFMQQILKQVDIEIPRNGVWKYLPRLKSEAYTFMSAEWR